MIELLADEEEVRPPLNAAARARIKESGVHSPGPWVAQRLNYKTSSWYVYSGECTPAQGAVAHIPNSSWKPSEANARLIAAAPDLLEALRIYAAYDEYINGPGGDPETDRLQKAKAAIAKATSHVQ